LPNLNLRGIHWVILGGESGPNARPMDLEWVTDLRNQYRWADVAFFSNSWAAFRRARQTVRSKGATWDQMPEQRIMPA
jgi:protein gp37